ncbi:MAG: PAS domain-containing sensor histidine kinase [Alphaproteobacteria bacterium]
MTKNNKKKKKETRKTGMLVRLGERGSWIPNDLAEFAFLLVGVSITMAAFAVSGYFVENIIKQEYEALAEQGAHSVAERLGSYENAMKALGGIVSASQDENMESAIEAIKKSDTFLTYFDELLLAYRKESGAWGFKVVYTRQSLPDRPQIETLNKDKSVLSRIIAQAGSYGQPPTVYSDSNLFVKLAEKPSDKSLSQPFLLMQSVKDKNRKEGILVGVVQSSNVLGQDWMRHNAEIIRIGLRDPDAGRDIFRFSRRGEGDDESWSYLQVYDFSFGNKKWEVRAEYGSKDNVTFLGMIPGFAAVFGFVLTIIGTGYIRGHKKQERRLLTMNKTLGLKNEELQSEMTKRQYLNAAIIKSENQNRAIIDSVSDVIFETDANGKILFLNKTWQKITGFESEQSQGLELFKMLHPQDQEKQAKDFQLLVKDQKQPYRCFTRLRTIDGTFRAVELVISMIRRDEAQNVRVVGTLIDVEERRRAERALGEAEKKFRTIVENAAGGIYQLTPEGLYLSANPALARILGYETPEHLLRMVKNANDLVYGNSRERQAFLKSLEERGHIYNHETEVLTHQGERIWVNENVRIVRDEPGNTLYYEGSMEDITHRKRSELALREAKVRSDLANRAKSEFLANMSHELRTPLNSIIGFSEIIHKETFGPIGQDAYKEYSKEIHESGRRLLKVISEILDISKIEAGDRRLNEDAVKIPSVVKSSLKLLENKAHSSNLTVTNNLLDDMPNVIAEELAVKQIVMNLLSNAIKFTPHGGHITINSEIERDGSLRLSFTDTGVGLDEDEIEKALSPFGQLDNALSRGNAGTGLGLTLVDALIKLHDGKLELLSKKGIGTTATVIFPPDRVAMKKPVNNTVKA